MADAVQQTIPEQASTARSGRPFIERRLSLAGRTRNNREPGSNANKPRLVRLGVLAQTPAFTGARGKGLHQSGTQPGAVS